MSRCYDDERAPQDQLMRGYHRSRPPAGFPPFVYRVTHTHGRKMHASRSPDADWLVVRSPAGATRHACVLASTCLSLFVSLLLTVGDTLARTTNASFFPIVRRRFSDICRADCKNCRSPLKSFQILEFSRDFRRRVSVMFSFFLLVHCRWNDYFEKWKENGNMNEYNRRCS